MRKSAGRQTFGTALATTAGQGRRTARRPDPQTRIWRGNRRYWTVGPRESCADHPAFGCSCQVYSPFLSRDFFGESSIRLRAPFLPDTLRNRTVFPFSASAQGSRSGSCLEIETIVQKSERRCSACLTAGRGRDDPRRAAFRPLLPLHTGTSPPHPAIVCGRRSAGCSISR